jgi:hypothetical protein
MKILYSLVMVLAAAAVCNAAKIAYWDCNHDPLTYELLDRVGSANGVLEDKLNPGNPALRMNFVTSGAGLGSNYGNALWTDRLDDRVSLGEVDAFDFGKSDFTVTGWFRSNNYARHGCIIRHGWWDVGGFDIVVLKNNGRVSFEVFGLTANKSVISDNVLNNDKWHWFAAVVRNEALYLYIDGVLQSNSGVTFDPGTSATVSGYGTYIDMDMAGSVDDLAIYNNALTGTLNSSNTLVAGGLYFVWHGVAETGPTTCEQVWASGYGNSADLNKNCRVDFKDFAVFAQQWLLCNIPNVTGCVANW